MNKKIIGFISVLVFSLIFIFSIANISFATLAPNATPISLSADQAGITTDSVKLKAYGDITPSTYIFTVYEESGYPNNRSLFQYASGPVNYPVTSSLSSIEVSLSGLKPSTRYVGVVYGDSYDNPSVVHFTTIDDPNSGTETVTMGTVTTTSVEVTATGLDNNSSYELYVTGDVGKTPSVSYEQKKSITAASGKVTFTGLTANNNYVAYIVKNGDKTYLLGRQYFVAKAAVINNGSNTSTNTTFSGIVPVCNTGVVDQKTGKFPVPCDFNFFMKLLNSIIKFLLFTIATPFVALIIMYTGYLYLTAGGNAGQTEKVKHILFSAVIGYIVALAAWLIVNTVLSSFGVDPSINTFLK